jgi:long-chain acyl-CoA synthetase
MPELVQHLLEASADLNPGKPAVWHRGEWMAYGELEQRANALAAALRAAGAVPGDRIGVMLENGFAFVISHFAIAKAGAVNLALNTELTPEGLEGILGDAGAEIVIAGRRQAATLAKLRTHALRLVLWEGDGTVPELPLSGARHLPLADAWALPAARPLPSRAGGDLAALVYTSGSTGRPKGVMLTHRNLLSNTASIVAYLGLSESDRVLAVLPFYYIFGLSLLYTHFHCGGSIVLENRFVYPNVALDTLAQSEATGFAGVPSTFQILLEKSTLRKRSFPALRYVAQAGGPMPVPVQQAVAEVFSPARLFVMYGATEASPRLTYLDPGLLPSKWGSIGKAIPGVEVFVADTEGNRLPPGETGEIVARGPNIMAGYWRDADATAEVIRNGLYFTGDLGREDGDGCLFITGRSRDILKVGGNRVGAAEVEAAIMEWGGALEAAVIGVEDPILGEVPKAFVVPRPPWDPEGLKAFLQKTLPPFKRPKYYEAIASLPKNGAGKIMKAALKTGAEVGGTGSPVTPSTNPPQTLS